MLKLKRSDTIREQKRKQKMINTKQDERNSCASLAFVACCALFYLVCLALSCLPLFACFCFCWAVSQAYSSAQVAAKLLQNCCKIAAKLSVGDTFMSNQQATPNVVQ